MTASHPALRSYPSSYGRRTEINTGPVVPFKKSRVHGRFQFIPVGLAGRTAIIGGKSSR